MGWYEDWQQMIRQVLFADEELKELMLIPEDKRDDALEFVDKYFIESPAPDEVMLKEDVRVLFYDEAGKETSHPFVTRKIFSIDVYVKKDKLYGGDEDDYMKRRDRLIFQRIRNLISKKRFKGYNFTCYDDYPLSCKVEGYARYHGVFYYKKTY